MFGSREAKTVDELRELSNLDSLESSKSGVRES